MEGAPLIAAKLHPPAPKPTALSRPALCAGALREIGAELYISHNTVKTHVRTIYRKLGAAGREEALQRACERGLL
ncbi:MAG TPA: LuxR C-terminal-related transcriptional regulator [Solirubrobacteraceae bacterium]|nr:LuxR C-terminal-related transcriptional regulator [Solirubrobacteraceae bacterium]